MSDVFSPVDNFAIQLYIEKIDANTGATAPATAGSYTGFLSINGGTAALAADPSLSVAGIYIGGANAPFTGKPGPGIIGCWQFFIPGTALTIALCQSLFKDGQKVFFVVTDYTGVRAQQIQIYRDALTMVPA